MAYFGASVDTIADNKRFAEELELDYALLSDPDKKVAAAYTVLSDRGLANRWTFYIDKEGIIKHIEGLPGSETRVDARGAGEQMAATLARLEFPRKDGK